MSEELEVAKQRVNAYRGCGHPLVPTAIWLLGEVQRLEKLVAEPAPDVEEEEASIDRKAHVAGVVEFIASAGALEAANFIVCQSEAIVGLARNNADLATEIGKLCRQREHWKSSSGASDAH